MLGPLRAGAVDLQPRLGDEVLEAAVVELDLGESQLSVLGRDDVERVDEVPEVVRGPQAVGDVDQQLAAVHRRQVELDVDHLDARLPVVERRADLVLHPRDRGRVDRVEDEVVHAAAELRAHRPLALGGGEDEVDRLVDVRLVGGERDAAAPVDLEREGDAGAEDLCHAAPPIRC